MSKNLKFYLLIAVASYLFICLFSIISATIHERKFDWSLLLVFLVYYVFIPLVTVASGIISCVLFKKISHFIFCIVFNFFLCFTSLVSIFYLGNVAGSVGITECLLYSTFMAGLMLVSMVVSVIIRNVLKSVLK